MLSRRHRADHIELSGAKTAGSCLGRFGGPPLSTGVRLSEAEANTDSEAHTKSEPESFLERPAAVFFSEKIAGGLVESGRVVSWLLRSRRHPSAEEAGRMRTQQQVMKELST
jgi:hypothetical protein